MYNEKFYLSTQDILDKEFKIDARGYRPQEVDKFLDMVIRDYTEFMNIIDKAFKIFKCTINWGNFAYSCYFTAEKSTFFIRYKFIL